MTFETFTMETWQVTLLVVAIVFELVMKAFALWRAAGNKDTAWFVILVVFSTVGILPIIYLLTHKTAQYTN